MHYLLRNHGRTTGAIAGAAMTLLVAAGSVLPAGMASAQETASGVLAATPAAIDCTTTAPSATAASFALVSEASAARYRVQEELADVGATEAVGETSAIIGQILFDEAGQPLACSRFDVDLRTLQSDNAGVTTTSTATRCRRSSFPWPPSS